MIRTRDGDPSTGTGGDGILSQIKPYGRPIPTIPSRCRASRLSRVSESGSYGSDVVRPPEIHRAINAYHNYDFEN